MDEVVSAVAVLWLLRRVSQVAGAGRRTGCAHLPHLRPVEGLWHVVEAACLLGAMGDATGSRMPPAVGPAARLARLLFVALHALALARRRKVCGVHLRLLALWLAWGEPGFAALEAAALLAAVALGEGDASELFEEVPCADLAFMQTQEPHGEAKAKAKAPTGGRPAERPPAQASSGSKTSKRHVVVLSMGSRGDVQPFLALGQALERSGEARVTIATMQAFEGLVTAHGLAFASCGMADLSLGHSIWRDATHVSEVISAAKDAVSDQYATVAAGFLAACRGGGSDGGHGGDGGDGGDGGHERQWSHGADLILATSVTSGFGLSIAEHLGVPCWTVSLAPDHPTRAFPPGAGGEGVPGGVPVGVPGAAGLGNLARWYWHWLRIANAARRAGAGAREQRSPENDFRVSQLGLQPLGGGKRLRQLGAVPCLCAFSRALVPKPHDWPVAKAVTGPWFVPRPARRLTARVERFLQRRASSPPSPSSPSSPSSTSSCVCVNFGSMTKPARSHGVVDAVLAALSGAHDVILVDPDFADDEIDCESDDGESDDGESDDGESDDGESDDGESDDGESEEDDATAADVRDEPVKRRRRVLRVREAEHEALFPRCAFVVHHGGAGTSARVVHAGVPSVVVPIMLWTDQPLWAGRLRDLRAGVHVDRRCMTPETLAAAQEACRGAEMREAARALAEEAGAHPDGLSVAVKLILGAA